MDTEGLSPAQWALLAATEGRSATSGLARFRQEGGRIANQTWYRMFAEILHSISNRIGIYNEPVYRIPVASEIQRWETNKARGYIHQVEVIARDKITGEIISIPFSVSSRTLHTRNSVLKAALATYKEEGESGKNQKILGAIYSGTYEAVPREG